MINQISERSVKVESSKIRDVFNKSVEMEDVIHLEIGQPDQDVPENVKEAARTAIKKGYSGYTHNAGYLDLRETISQNIKEEYDIHASPEKEIIVTAGATNALVLAYTTILDPGDEILIPDPGYPAYKSLSYLSNAKPIPVPLEENNGFKMSKEAILSKLSKDTKAIVINSPQNPTGSVLEKKDLKAISEIARDNNLYVISDEPYEKITYDGFEHHSIASFDERTDKTITIQTLSKTYSMTGWRIGYAVSNENMIRTMTKLQEIVASCASSISQRAAISALENCNDYVERIKKKYSSRRDILLNELSELDVSYVEPRGAFYLYLDISNHSENCERFVNNLLEQKKVAVAPGTAFGSHNTKKYIRISYCNSKNKIKEAMNRFKGFLTN